MVKILGDIITVAGTLFTVAAILYLSYIVSKRVGKGMAAVHNSRHMKIIDRMFVGQDRSLLIVHIGGRYCLVGVSAAGIQFLSELEESDITELTPDMPPPDNFPAFSDIFSGKLFNAKRNKK